MVTKLNSRKARSALDERLRSFGSSDSYTAPQAGWVRAIRDALGMSAAELGGRMGVSHPAVFELERNERNGTARLETLRRAAVAMDCQLIYAFVPKQSLEHTVRAQATKIARGDLRSVAQTMALEDQAEPITPELEEEVIQKLIASRRLWSRQE